jgi:hypothetical protein
MTTPTINELQKLIDRARFCKNTGEEFIWDNSWLNKCQEELDGLFQDLLEAKRVIELAELTDGQYPSDCVARKVAQLYLHTAKEA